jgi:hypothetical protein
MTAAQAAAHAGVSRQTIRNWNKAGLLPAVRQQRSGGGLAGIYLRSDVTAVAALSVTERQQRSNKKRARPGKDEDWQRREVERERDDLRAELRQCEAELDMLNRHLEEVLEESDAQRRRYAEMQSQLRARRGPRHLGDILAGPEGQEASPDSSA